MSLFDSLNNHNPPAARRWILLAALFVFVVTAVNSVGYHYFDEHFQILEFAGLKRGGLSPEQMSWEYHERMRPAAQPLLAFLALELIEGLGITSPDSQAMFLRLLSALFILVALLLLVGRLLPEVKPEHGTIFLALSFFLYLIPYNAVRFSSETWSMGAFVVGFAFLLRWLRTGSGSLVVVGLLLGFSFVFRYQSVLLIAGVLAWMFFFRKKWFLREGGGLVAGILGAVLIGLLIDWWFYGEFCLTSWNYLMQGDKSASFGTAPPWEYLRMVMLPKAIAPLGLLFILSTLLFILLHPKHIITFLLVPFLLVHILIPHKELRFLFSLVPFLPFILVTFWESVETYVERNRILSGLAVACLALFGLLNLAALCGVMLTPANGQPLVWRYFREEHRGEEIAILYLEQPDDFLEKQAGMPMPFYQLPEHSLVKTRVEEVADIVDSSSRPVFFLTNDTTVMEGLPVVPVWRLRSEFLDAVNLWDWQYHRNLAWVIYRGDSRR